MSDTTLLPPSVRRQIEQANAIARDVGLMPADPGRGGGTGDPAPQPAPVQPSGEPTGASPAPAADPAPAPATPPPAADPAPEPWEQRYKTLKGKYDREVPELRQHLDALRRQVDTLSADLADARRAPPPAAAPAPTPAAPVGVTEQERQDYGDELLDVIRRQARAEVSQELDQLRRQVADLLPVKETAQQVASRLNQSQMEAALDRAVPKWRETNTDAEFLGWLRLPDPFSGQVRHNLLLDAWNAGDIARTSAFFKQWQSEQTVHVPAATPAHTPPAGAGRPSLAEMASPGRVPVSGGGAPAGQKVWTRDEISAFYRDAQRGAYAGRDAERIATERDILAAAREGRVR